MISILKTNKPIITITSEKDAKEFMSQLDKDGRVFTGQVVIYFQNNFHFASKLHLTMMKYFGQTNCYNFDVIYITDKEVDSHIKLTAGSKYYLKPLRY
ncbi:MAG: hypothetical protein WC389_17365 [Lutibacter sp.]|jgi:hypothetical protein